MSENVSDLYDIENELNVLKEKQFVEIEKKKKYEVQLAEIKNKIRSRGLLPRDEYQALCRRQDVLKRETVKQERKINEIKLEMNRWNALHQDIKMRLAPHPPQSIALDGSFHLASKIKALRQQYLDFAEDQTRVNSMRVMAAQFANELTMLLRDG